MRARRCRRLLLIGQSARTYWRILTRNGRGGVEAHGRPVGRVGAIVGGRDHAAARGTWDERQFLADRPRHRGVDEIVDRAPVLPREVFEDLPQEITALERAAAPPIARIELARPQARLREVDADREL